MTFNPEAVFPPEYGTHLMQKDCYYEILQIAEHKGSTAFFVSGFKNTCTSAKITRLMAKSQHRHGSSSVQRDHNFGEWGDLCS